MQRPSFSWPVADLSFVDESHAWLTTQHALLFSSDAGLSWQDAGLPHSDFYFAAAFADTAHGMIAGYDSASKYAMVLATQDGGASWKQQLFSEVTLRSSWPPDLRLSYPDSSTAYALIRGLPFKFTLPSSNVDANHSENSGPQIVWALESAKIEGLKNAKRFSVKAFDEIGREVPTLSITRNADALTVRFAYNMRRPVFLLVKSDEESYFLK